MLLAGIALACIILGPASARTQGPAKYGGTLVVGLNTVDPGTLDPTLTQGLSTLQIDKSFCEQLYDYDAKTRIVPQLAAALPVISKDKLTYTIAVRQGIQFNDGTPLNAQAVVTTLQRMISLPGSTRASDLSSVDAVTVSGPYTVVIHLKTRFTPLTEILATVDGVVLSPTQLAKLGTDFGANPVCVGPFMFDHRVVGDNVTVVKSPYYYNRGAVHLDKIVYRMLPDTAAASAALRAGDLQVLDSMSPTELPAVRQSSSLRVLQTDGLGWRGIVINLGNKNGLGNLPYSSVGTPLASSPSLRQAFEQAIDRDAMNRVVFGGTTQVGCTPVSPSSPSFDAGIKCTPYSPAGARKLVARSGVSNPTVHLLVNVQGDNQRIAQFIQAEEAAVGITVVIDSVAGTGPFALSGSFDTMLTGPASGASTDQDIYDWTATSGLRNYGGYSNPRLDLILANSRKATSPAALRTLYHAAQLIIAADRPTIFLFHSSRLVGFTDAVTGVQEYPADLLLRVAFAQYR